MERLSGNPVNISNWSEQLYRALKPSDPYYQRWQRFRTALFLRTWGGILFLPIFFGLLFLSLYVMPLTAGWFTAGGITLGLLFVALHQYPLTCPDCRRCFYAQTFWDRSAYYRQERCIHCGLQLYAPNDD